MNNNAMPFVLSRMITENEKPLWGEGSPYSKTPIYSIENCCGGPPVNYDAHVIKPHSIPHIDAPAHIIDGGKRLDFFFKKERLDTFYGPAVVIKVDRIEWEKCPVNPGNFVHKISKSELVKHLVKVSGKYDQTPPKRLLLDVADTQI